MKMVRPLARVAVPIVGESFTSYVERLAAMHKVDLLVMLNMLGIIDEERYQRLNGYGIFLSLDQLEKFSIATRIPEAMASQMLLSFYDGIAFDLKGVQAGDAEGLRKRATSEWAYFSGSHACPHCLRENQGTWKLAWKLPWSFACLQHNCYLISHCPGCERRLAIGRSDRSLSPLFVRQVPSPGFCGNAKAYGMGRMGRSSVACGHALREIQTVSAGKTFLQTQKILDKALSGKPPRILDCEVSSLEYFKDLRSVCALALYCAEPEDLYGISPAEMSEFSVYADKRNRIRDERSEAATPRNSARSRAFSGCQTNPLIMATVSYIATEILASDSITAMAELMHPLAERCIVGNIAKRRWEVMKFFHFSERLAQAFHESLAKKARFDRAIGARSVNLRNFRYDFEPCHVPQLLWKTEFEKNFSVFFPNVADNYARRFCSMSLIKLCGNYTWGEAALTLGLPEKSSIKMANRCVVVLGSGRTKLDFGNALHQLATRLAAQVEKLDFAFLRESFSTLADIPEQDWLTICSHAGIAVGQPGRRSKYAAVWVWSHITHGDWSLAPGLIGEHKINSREVYRTLNKTVFPKVRRFLNDYSDVILRKTLRQDREG